MFEVDWRKENIKNREQKEDNLFKRKYSLLVTFSSCTQDSRKDRRKEKGKKRKHLTKATPIRAHVKGKTLLDLGFQCRRYPGGSFPGVSPRVMFAVIRSRQKSFVNFQN